MAVKFTKPEINVREKLAELDKPSGIAGEAILRAETPQEQFNLIGAGRRNILINGDFQVSQRGDYSSATTSSDGYFLDRWRVDRNGTATVQHTSGHDIAETPAICKAIKLVQTVTGTNYLGIRQKIETPAQYIGRTFTYSAWVRSNTSNARIACYIPGTSPNTYIGPNHSGSGEWEYLSFTFTLNSGTPTTFHADVFIDNGAYGNTTITAGEYVEVTMLQLELGKVATPFEHRSYGEELALCQRYFYKAASSNGYMYSMLGVHATLGEIQYYPPVTMRTAPSVSIHDRSPYWEVFPWNTVGNDSIYITSIHSGHMSPDGHGQVGVFFSGTTGSYVTPNLVRGLNYAIRADFISFEADL